MTGPPKSKAIERLRKALNKIPELKELSTDSLEFKLWRRNTELAIRNIFGSETPHSQEFTTISYSVGRSYNAQYRIYQDYLKGLGSAAALIMSMIKEIEEYWDDEDEEQAERLNGPQGDGQIDTKRVFVVHGRDEGTKQTVARFLEKLGLEPVILDEKADRGRTIIEKFEQEAQEVGFAVVLLTADDEGRLQDKEADLRPRARQNVVFELGYFAGALGRNRVCALTKGDVEIPSDYSGVVYIPLDDAGGWKMELVKELKAAGFDVDANLAL